MKTFEVTLPPLHPGQEKIRDALSKHRFVVALCGRRAGKCFPFGEKLWLSSGRFVNVEELIGESHLIPSFEGESPICVDKLAFFQEIEPKETFEVETALGLKLRRSYDHPILTQHGFVSTKDLAPGMRICISRDFRVGGTDTMDKDSLEFLAILLAYAHFGDCVTSLYLAESQVLTRCIELFKHKYPEGGTKRLNRRTCFVFKRSGRSPFYKWLRNLGLAGTGFRHKFIPRVVFEQSPNARKFFIQKLLECKSKCLLTGAGYPTLQFATESEGLARDLQLLLFSCGVASTVYQTDAGTLHPTWSLVVEGPDIHRLKREVGCGFPLLDDNQRQLSDVVWDRVTSVKSIGTQRTVAVSVPETERLMTPVMEHNSVGASIIMLERALKYEDYICWWVAPSYKLMKRNAFRLLKKLIIPQLTKYISEADMFIEFSNGSIIQFKSADRPDALLGEGLNFVVVDEAAECKPHVWYEYLSPALSDKMGQALFTSRPRGGWFQELCRELQETGQGTVVHFTSRDNPFFPPEEWEAAQKRLPPAVFKAEYEAEWVGGLSPVFPYIDEVLVEKDYATAAPVIIGVDPGGARDFFALAVVNTDKQILRLDHFKHMPWDRQLSHIISLARKYDAQVWIDSHGIGYGYFESLSSTNVGPRIRACPVSTRAIRAKIFQGLAFELDPHATSQPLSIAKDLPPECKPSLIELKKEMAAVDYQLLSNGEIKYSTSEGVHDDLLIALGLAVSGIHARSTASILVRYKAPTRIIRSVPQRQYTVERKYTQRVVAKKGGVPSG